MISLSSHVLDTTLGKPAAGMQIELTDAVGNNFITMTDEDGRCSAWGDIELTASVYQLRFFTGSYLLEKHGNSFYPFVDIHFEVTQDGGHYHVPLLISPFGFSSYRGS
ncbi:hydroxyisourate hydrolase [Aliiglaciecola sp. LCG003]|uniref:hydroxyisourate hydrolase n=1 Tax=Aliiglaciecola sp. LCG003 TaxID=3053655 RepID=UPI0025731A91|nr:hydroxyisourate hydrolase [Aliiglaciecola sp. LCG003]WJG11214.1 hydroxyisourate hydrolase [Aliiglaciecola sp. LCG003]